MSKLHQGDLAAAQAGDESTLDSKLVTTLAKNDTASFAAGPQGRPPSAITNWIEFPAAGYNPSREALGVWIQNGSAWKIYAKDTVKKTVVAALQTARNANLPLVPIQAISAGGLAEPTSGDVASPMRVAKTTYGFCVRAQYRSSPWVFFSAQTGGLSKFEGELKKITDKNVLLIFKAGLEIAVRIRLSDPQGFINPTSAGAAIEFMDIHIGSDSAAIQLLEKVDARIKQLG